MKWSWEELVMLAKNDLRADRPTETLKMIFDAMYDEDEIHNPSCSCGYCERIRRAWRV